jgi:DnaJ-class molecular chaperone
MYFEVCWECEGTGVTNHSPHDDWSLLDMCPECYGTGEIYLEEEDDDSSS